MVKPLFDRVLVQPLQVDDKSPGGLFIPDVAKEKAQRGKIVAVGTKGSVKSETGAFSFEVHVGDKVLFGKYSGNEIRLEGKDMIIMREEDILAILE